MSSDTFKSRTPPGSPTGLRAANRDRILRLLRTRGAMTQAELARASGLSPATVSSIARELRDGGWLKGGEAGGRGTALVLDGAAGIALGIDFDHDHLRVAVADLAHTILAEAEEPLDTDHAAHEGIALAGRLVRGLLAQAGVAPERVAGVGMGIPGPLPAAGGAIGDSAILPAWIGIEPGALMSSELGIDVLVENDANLGALAECVWGAGRGHSDVLYVKAGAGVGAGLMLGGRLHRGARGTAGELGHLTIDPSGPVCRCGNRGCVEALTGAEAIVGLLRPRHGASLTLADVIELARAGDHGCRLVIGDAGRTLGLAVAGACNLLAPELVIVGGELAQAGDLLLDPLRAAVRRAGIAAMREIPVTAGVLGERAEVLGAVALALSESPRYVEDPR
jgi:predicted NBD/HSP70 family sugar kinase